MGRTIPPYQGEKVWRKMTGDTANLRLFTESGASYQRKWPEIPCGKTCWQRYLNVGERTRLTRQRPPPGNAKSTLPRRDAASASVFGVILLEFRNSLKVAPFLRSDDV